MQATNQNLNYGIGISMNLLAAILPLLIFVIADSISSPKLGIYAAIATSLAFLAWDTWTTGALDWTLFLEPVIITICGVVSLKLNKTGLFKYQPTVVGAVLCLFIFGYQFLHEPLLSHYWSVVARHLEPEQLNILMSKNVLQKLPALSITYGVAIGVHAIAMWFVTKHMSNVFWILGRLAIYPILFVATVFFFVT